MNEQEILVEQTENVKTTTEEIPAPKTYTQEEVDAIVGKAKARAKAKTEREYQRKYGDLENVLRAGTGKESVDEMTNTFAEFYRNKGINIPEKPKYSQKDIEVLARAEANEIINSGFEDVVEEVDRLTSVGFGNMSDREKALFKVLAEHRQSAERGRELNKIGVTEDVYNSRDFQDFAGKFNSNTPIRDIYDIYAKTKKPQKEIKPMGSMKNNNSGDNGVKEFYTVEEARRFTRKDYEKNPALFAAVERSMQKWK